VSYQDDLKSHLAEYKRLHLGIIEPGVFRYRGRNLLYHHILPLAKASANLLSEAQSTASAFLAVDPRKRHRYFHHLNSSQAFAFSLFFPYFSGGPVAASVLLRALGQKGALAKWEPEAVLVPDEETNIDVCWETSDGLATFCEVKLSEADFGKAVDDARHRAKLRDIYSKALGSHLQRSRLEPSVFFNAYQFNRNLWHMVRTDRSRLIFLLPRSNTRLWRLLQGLLVGVVPITQERISVIAIEDVIANLLADDECPEWLRKYPSKLNQKYIIKSTSQ
jgi:Restriction Endonuclease associating with ARP